MKRNELGIDASDFVVISVGELNTNKKHQVIIRAIQEMPDVKHVIVGKGALYKELNKLAKGLCVDRRVFYPRL